MLRLVLLIRVCICICGLLIGSHLGATTSKDYVFINNTGKPANDLHIQFDSEVKLVNPAPNPSDKYVGSKFRSSKLSTEGGRSQVHFKNRGRSAAKVVGNGEQVWGRFATEEEDLHIVSWYWTFNGDTIGTVMHGDLVKAQQSNSLVVPGSDVVTELEFENNIYKGRKDGAGSAVINDLHIVTTRPVQSINEGLAETPFRKATTIHCECSTLGPPGRARTRALNRLPEPCRSLCADSRTDLYVVQLDSTAKRIPAGTKIPVKLRGDDTAEVLQWWFTENGYPIKFREGRYEDKGLKGEPKRDGKKGEPLKLGSGDRDSRYKPGGKLKDKGEIYSIAQNFTPSYNRSAFRLSLDLLGTSQYNSGLSNAILPTPNLIMDVLLERYGEDLFKDFGELIIQEGELSADRIIFPGAAMAIGIPFTGKWRLGLESGISQAKVAGIIPVISLNDGFTMPQQIPWEANVQQLDFHAYIVHQIGGHFSAGIGGFISQQKVNRSELMLFSQASPLPSEWRRTRKGLSLQMGVVLPLSGQSSFVLNGRWKTIIDQENAIHIPELTAGIRLNIAVSRNQ